MRESAVALRWPSQSKTCRHVCIAERWWNVAGDNIPPGWIAGMLRRYVNLHRPAMELARLHSGQSPTECPHRGRIANCGHWLRSVARCGKRGSVSRLGMRHEHADK
jgi:hypothetical protein